MTDWTPFLKSDTFRAYRKKQVESIAEVLNSQYSAIVVGCGSDLAETKGQMAMAKRLLELPKTLTNDEETLEYLDMQLIEDMANLTGMLMRKLINERP